MGMDCMTHFLRHPARYRHLDEYRHGRRVRTPTEAVSEQDLQAYLAHKKLPPPLGSPYGPRQRPTLGS